MTKSNIIPVIISLLTATNTKMVKISTKETEAREIEINFILKREASGKFRIFGTVKNEAGEALQGALLKIDGEIEQKTDLNGYYEFKDLDFEYGSTHEIQCSKAGYETQKKEFIASIKDFVDVHIESPLGTRVTEVKLGNEFYIKGSLQDGAIQEQVWAYETDVSGVPLTPYNRLSGLVSEMHDFVIGPFTATKVGTIYFVCFDEKQAPKSTTP